MHPPDHLEKLICRNGAVQNIDVFPEADLFCDPPGVAAIVGHPAITPGFGFICPVKSFFTILQDEHLALVYRLLLSRDTDRSFSGSDDMKMISVSYIRTGHSSGISVFHAAGYKKQIPQLFVVVFQTMVINIPFGLIDPSHLFSKGLRENPQACMVRYRPFPPDRVSLLFRFFIARLQEPHSSSLPFVCTHPPWKRDPAMRQPVRW